MSFFSNRNEVDLHDEVAALRREMAALSSTMSKLGKAAYRDARHEAADLYDGISARVSDALPVIRRHARDVEDTIRENPARTLGAVGLVALVVVAAVLLNGNRR